MLGMEQNGEAKFFSDPEKSSWMIDMRNGLALMEKDEKENYFVKKLDELGNDGWELAATIGNERPTYIFKRIKK